MSVKRGDTAENIHGAALHTVLVDERDIAVLDLDGHRNQHRVAGNFHKICQHIEGHEVDTDLVTDHLFQIFKLNRWRCLELGVLLEAVEFLAFCEGRGSDSKRFQPPWSSRLALDAKPIDS